MKSDLASFDEINEVLHNLLAMQILASAMVFGLAAGSISAAKPGFEAGFGLREAASTARWANTGIEPAPWKNEFRCWNVLLAIPCCEGCDEWGLHATKWKWAADVAQIEAGFVAEIGPAEVHLTAEIRLREAMKNAAEMRWIAAGMS